MKMETLKKCATLDDALSEALNPLIPKFFYFDDYASLPGIEKIRELLEADPATLNDERLTARSLLNATGADKTISSTQITRRANANLRMWQMLSLRRY